MKRRSFFGLLAGGVAALGVKPWLTPAPPGERRSMSEASTSGHRATLSMEQYTSDAFASRVGQVFSFHRTADANDPAIRLELIDVQSSPHHTMAGARQPFSLLFALRSDDATRESTLHLRHEEFAPCAWFVNRVTAPKHDLRVAYYEAVFG
jgi:hypothetical protein